MDLIFLKTLGASLAFVLAHPEPRDHAPALRKNPPFRLGTRIPRVVAPPPGDVILLPFLLIAYHCVRYRYIDPGSPRILSYAILGSLTLAVLALKLLTVRWIPRLMRWIAVIGASLLVVTTGTVLTSALW